LRCDPEIQPQQNLGPCSSSLCNQVDSPKRAMHDGGSHDGSMSHPHHWAHVADDSPFGSSVPSSCIVRPPLHQSAQFPNTDNRLVAATLKLQLKSRRMVPSQPQLDVDKLKDERLAEEFANRLSGDLGDLGPLGDPEELWSAFKTTVLDVAGRCLGTH